MSNWSAELININQPDCPNPDNNVNKNDRDDRQDQALPSNWRDKENFWSGKMYDKAKPIAIKPVPVPPPRREDEESDWSKHLTHITTGLRFHCRFLLPNLPRLAQRHQDKPKH